MKKRLCTGVAVAVVVSVGLSASASASPPVPAPPGSECTFDSGVTTCVMTTEFRQVHANIVEDPACPSGWAESRSGQTTKVRTTTVFRGMQQLGEPQTETTHLGFGSYGCVPE
jgi:hypothetical protein